MFKKIVSLMVAVLMIASCAVVAVSAAEVTDATVAADVNSSDVAADENSSQVAADESSSTSAAADAINFEQPDNWKSVKAMYCHIWMCVDDGSVTWPSWKSKAEKMTLGEDGKTWSYDVSKLPAKLDSSKGAGYAVIFAADTGMQTYNLIMDAGCIGDTAYATGNTFENPEDSEKTCIEAKWKNSAYGPEKKITTSGKLVGDTLPAGSTDVTLLAQFIKTWHADKTKMGFVPNLVSTLGVKGSDVYAEIISMFDTEIKNLKAKGEDTTDKEKDKTTCLANAKSVLGISDDDVKEAEEKASSTTGGGSSSSGSGSGSGSGSSSSSGSGSSSSSGSNNSVSSGQDSTIVFVLGGVMFAAAAIMFVTRKRKD